MTTPVAPDKNSLEDLSRSEFHQELHKPFTIGLKPLAGKNLLQIDGDLLPYRQQKQDYYNRSHDQVCMAEEDTIDAQREINI